MTIDKAIEILSDSANRGMTTFNQDFSDAERLGIEALKFRHRWEDQEGEDDFPLLAGETLDKPSAAPSKGAEEKQRR